MQLLLATRNPGKQRELTQLVNDQSVSILTLDEISPPFTDEIAETGSTFEENALLKAQTIGDYAQLPTIADDSGLEVECLHGFPGVNSARWHAGTDADRNRALLKKMKRRSDRMAQFRCVLCLYTPTTKKHTLFYGALKGSIAEHAAGDHGFGYDSIFIPEGQNKTLAQLPIDYKQQYSHRAIATHKLVTYLKNL